MQTETYEIVLQVMRDVHRCLLTQMQAMIFHQVDLKLCAKEVIQKGANDRPPFQRTGSDLCKPQEGTKIKAGWFHPDHKYFHLSLTIHLGISEGYCSDL